VACSLHHRIEVAPHAELALEEPPQCPEEQGRVVPGEGASSLEYAASNTTRRKRGTLLYSPRRARRPRVQSAAMGISVPASGPKPSCLRRRRPRLRRRERYAGSCQYAPTLSWTAGRRLAQGPDVARGGEAQPVAEGAWTASLWPDSARRTSVFFVRPIRCSACGVDL
jgi:hypothetical protein